MKEFKFIVIPASALGMLLLASCSSGVGASKSTVSTQPTTIIQAEAPTNVSVSPLAARTNSGMSEAYAPGGSVYNQQVPAAGSSASIRAQIAAAEEPPVSVSVGPLLAQVAPAPAPVDAARIRKIEAGLAQSEQQTPAATNVPVLLSDFRIDAPASLPPGKYDFRVSDTGAALHALAIVGPNVNAATDTLGPGQSTTLTVQLEPGVYTLTCPVPGHVDKGMQATLAVA